MVQQVYKEVVNYSFTINKATLRVSLVFIKTTDKQS